MATAFHSAYLDSATPFWPSHFSNASDRRQRTLAAAQKKIAPELLAVLHEQNPHVDLGQGSVALVVTGQQIGLFLGPLYTIYKAATAIALARRLSEETGVTCLPLFWLQTEDHDFAEIAASTFIDAGGHIARVELAEDPAQARTSVGQRSLGKQITPLIATLSEALGEHGRAVSELIAKHYRPGARLVDAFAGVLRAIFANDDLLVFNPRDARVAGLAKNLWRTALNDSEAIEARLNTRDQALQLAGFHQQIKLRPQSPLVFFHADKEDGPRHRLQRTTNGFVDRSETLSASALLALCERAPLRFSTSAMLRPLLQDTLLPTAAYVGGAAELDYFAQIEPLYAHFGLVPPLLFHRARFRLWPVPARRLLEQLGLSADDTTRPFEELCRRLAPPVSGLPEEEWKALEARLAAFAEQAPAMVKKTTLRAQRSIADAMGRLTRVTHRAQSDQEDGTESRLRRLLAWTQPEGHAQERALGFMSFVARSSVEDFRATILSALDPFDASLKDIHL